MKCKAIFSMVLIGGFCLVFYACSNSGKDEKKETKQESEQGTNKSDMHKQHESLKNNFAHQNIILLDKQYKPKNTTAQDLQRLLGSYITLKNTCFKGDLKTINQAGSTMLEQVKNIDTEMNSKEGKEALQQHVKLYKDKLKEMLHIEGLKEKRSYLGHISEIVYCTIKSFDFRKDQELYAAFCPMAFDNRGAYWLTRSRSIRNPYFGDKMPDCGSIEETL